MVSESKKRANKKWDDENLEKVTLSIPKGEKDRIKALAAASGLSMTQYILTAVKEKESWDRLKGIGQKEEELG